VKLWESCGARWVAVCCRLQATDATVKLGEVANSVGKRGWVGARVLLGVCHRRCWGGKGYRSACAGIRRPLECRLGRESARARILPSPARKGDQTLNASLLPIH